MNVLKGLKPEKVFMFFEEISAIPRGSGNTEKIRDYCADFAKKKNLQYICDDAGNIIIYKPQQGRELSAPIIIQGHLDMVWEKDETSKINFETDGLELCVDGDFVRAKGTTLGADDGIAVAMCLAILDSNKIVHPPLEVIFTADEEVGMSGASGLDESVLKSKRMINLDSEAENVLWVSCAGGVRADISFNAERSEDYSDKFRLVVCELHGGHSGAEIHKGYANANKVMGKVLELFKSKCDFNICSINGGLMDNAITRECECIVSSDDNIVGFVNNLNEDVCNEYRDSDPDIKIFARKIDYENFSFTRNESDRFISLLNKLPYGVISMSKDIEGLVETSLNPGCVKTEKNTVNIRFSVRSGVDSEREKLCEKLSRICSEFGCEINFSSPYPAWEYKKKSELRDEMQRIYYDMFGKKLNVTAIHAGLECGIFCGKIDGLDCVSLGPDMYDIHTPNERLSISSVQRVWKYLLSVLEII